MNSNYVDVEEKLSGVSELSSSPSLNNDETCVDLDPKRYFQSWLAGVRPSLSKSRERCHQTRRGEIVFDGTVTVDGSISADIRSATGVIVVAESGEIDGDISVEAAIVQGLVRGEIKAVSVDLASTARVIGHIHTSALAVQAGAWFEGQSAYLSNSAAPERGSTSESYRSPERDEIEQDAFSEVVAA